MCVVINLGNRLTNQVWKDRAYTHSIAGISVSYNGTVTLYLNYAFRCLHLSLRLKPLKDEDKM